VVRNLFSIFDPTTEINDLPLNGTRTAIGLLLIPTTVIMTRQKSGLVAVPRAVPVEHDELSVFCAVPSSIRGQSYAKPSHKQDVSYHVKYLKL
jgi:hypothetical protein